MKKIPPQSDIDFRIAFAQSHNLSVALVAPSTQNWRANNEIEEKLEYWQAYFYKKLVTEPIAEAKEAVRKEKGYPDEILNNEVDDIVQKVYNKEPILHSDFEKAIDGNPEASKKIGEANRAVKRADRQEKKEENQPINLD